MSHREIISARTVEGLRRLSGEEPITAKVRGACMEPVLVDGDMVIVESRRFYWPGDILVFPVGDALRAHRLLCYSPTREGLAAITRPDTSIDAWDAPVPTERILGRVTALAAGRPIRVGGGDRLRAVGRFLRLVARKLSQKQQTSP